MRTAIDARVLGKLDDWLRQKELPGQIELYIRLVGLQIEAKDNIRIKDDVISEIAVSNKIRNNLCVFDFDSLDIDWQYAVSLFHTALSIIREYLEVADLPADISFQQVARLWYERRPLPKRIDIEPDCLQAAMLTALKPFLMIHAETTLPKIDQKAWRRGSCPICGGKPNFSFLSREQEGARWLMCPRCNAEWLFQRLECPFCGNDDQKKLAYFSTEGDVYRVYTCEKCMSYIKSIDLRRAKGDIVLPLEWISTLDLDRQACEEGYNAGN